MARHSPTPASCCVVLITLMSGVVSPLLAQTQEGPRGIPSNTISSTMVSALARQVAFVKSFSAAYPSQFRQEQGAEKTGAVAVNGIKTQGK